MRSPFAASLVAASLALLGTARAEDASLATLSFAGSSTALSPGARGTVRLTITPAAGFALERNAPFSVELASEGLSLSKRALGPRDLPKDAEGPVALSVPFTADEAGTHAVEVEAVFFVCDSQRCQRQVRAETLEVSVEP